MSWFAKYGDAYRADYQEGLLLVYWTREQRKARRYESKKEAEAAAPNGRAVKVVSKKSSRKPFSEKFWPSAAPPPEPVLDKYPSDRRLCSLGAVFGHLAEGRTLRRCWWTRLGVQVVHEVRREPGTTFSLEYRREDPYAEWRNFHCLFFSGDWWVVK